MSKTIGTGLAVALALAAMLTLGCWKKTQGSWQSSRKVIVASDTLLSGMVATLLPSTGYEVLTILPPAQCPGHYDIKLTDVEKLRNADLVVSFAGMPFMEKADIDPARRLFLDPKGRNWMAPDSHITGLHILAEELSKRFPKEKEWIYRRLHNSARSIEAQARALKHRLKLAGAEGAPVLASAMQKESLEWMGFRVVGQYGRPESMSAKDIVRLSQIGKQMKAVLVVDNLQSGPEAGKPISEFLKIPHVTLTNFPSEKGYEASLNENASSLLAALRAQ